MWKPFLFTTALALAACAAPGGMQSVAVKSREVPTAFFVFFELNSAEISASDRKVIKEVLAFMTYYDTLSARVVAHTGNSEASSVPGFPLDLQRSTLIVGELVDGGISASRLAPINLGNRESMAGAAGGDEAVDRRVEIIMFAGPLETQ